MRIILKYPDLSSGSEIVTVLPSVLQQSLSGKELLQEIFTLSIVTALPILLVILNLNVAGIARKVVEFAAKFFTDAVGVLRIVDSPLMKV